MDITTKNALISVSVSILVFIAGQILIWYREKCRKRNEIKNYRQMIFTFIELMNDNIKKTIDNCNNLSEKIKNCKWMEIEKSNKWIIISDKIDKFSVDKFMNIFITNSTKIDDTNTKYVYNMIKDFRYLSIVNDELDNKHTAYTTAMNNISNHWQFASKSMEEFNAEILRTNQQFYIQWIAPIIMDSQKNSLNTYYDYKTRYVDKLISVYQQIPQYYTQSFRLYMMFYDIDMQYQIVKNVHSTNFKEIVINLERTYKDLLEIKQYFEKTKVKCIFSIK